MGLLMLPMLVCTKGLVILSPRSLRLYLVHVPRLKTSLLAEPTNET
jgi:hypothetical protein